MLLASLNLVLLRVAKRLIGQRDCAQRIGLQVEDLGQLSFPVAEPSQVLRDASCGRLLTGLPWLVAEKIVIGNGLRDLRQFHVGQKSVMRREAFTFPREPHSDILILDLDWTTQNAGEPPNYLQKVRINSSNRQGVKKEDGLPINNV